MTAADDYHADIFINENSVDLIGRNISIEADHVIVATGAAVVAMATGRRR